MNRQLVWSGDRADGVRKGERRNRREKWTALSHKQASEMQDESSGNLTIVVRTMIIMTTYNANSVSSSSVAVCSSFLSILASVVCRDEERRKGLIRCSYREMQCTHHSYKYACCWWSIKERLFHVAAHTDLSARCCCPREKVNEPRIAHKCIFNW